ncbi:MAG: DUF1289 domain-containing protein [Candidatus Krumholzibacteria bacterium]|nr:DUF1289 domain-containing protein [Candidatus Krumholzibacteria bacterium]
MNGSFENRNDEVSSPCDGDCVIDSKTGYCDGCMRTLEELERWGLMSPDEKRALLVILEARRARRSGA